MREIIGYNHLITKAYLVIKYLFMIGSVLFLYPYYRLRRPVGIIICLLLCIFTLQAQNEKSASKKISGKISDSISGRPVEYATISLFTQPDNKLVNGTTSDNKGVFKLTDVSIGTYKIIIDFIGYKRSEKNNIVISKEYPEAFLGNIKISSKQTTLKEVTVTGEKNLIVNKIDKMVYLAEKDISSQSG
ncbi:MAG: carboxypeptidase-like regulatory domain-containing protein, partial [Bacteroidota bacterium]